LYYWEVADAHQLLQSSLQRLHNDTGACDASSAPSTASSGSRRAQRRRQHQEQEDSSSSLIPLVQSIKELAECQRQLVQDCSEDRHHERELEQLRQESQRALQNQERRFRRRAELADLARKYRKLNAELNENDENSRRLLEFYMQESLLLQDEIRRLDSSCGDDNNGSNSTSLSLYS
jgi:predicted RNase H-like nuclease (RuvC/YqgF family)